MKGKAIIPLVLGLAVGLLAVKFVVDSIRKAQSSRESLPTFKVVRARQDINAYEQITERMLEVIESSDENIAPAKDRFESTEDLTERVTAKTIPMYVPILKSMLAPKGTKPGMVGRIPPGFRAVSVRIDEVTGVAYQLKPGDWVDVLVVRDVDTGLRRRETVSEVVLQRVQVAAIGRGSQSDQNTGVTKGKAAKSATLFVHKKDVPKLHLAASRGKITLAMRGKDESTTTVEKAPAANMTDLLAQMTGMFPKGGVKPLPVKEDEPHEVVIYRGSWDPNDGVAAERVVFQNRYSSNIVKVTHGSSARSSRRISTESRAGKKQTGATGKQVTGSVVKFNENADKRNSKKGANDTGGDL